MALATGTKLGPYEILSPLGAGGMGEVYRARDTRLDRTVAIKVLPAHLSENPDLRARFEREAKSISALQHPNICVLYDVGQQDGFDFLVMECLEGETLAARVQRKPMTASETLRAGIEIADALDRAHRSGIVHRDLKPANVMLTKSGAKLMDFGLAKLQAIGNSTQIDLPAFSAVATMPSLASPITVAGTIVGTVQYMSPEQIQGKEADARSDIFAFGALLYEMLTGKRAFDGKSQLSVASAVLEKDPEPISTLQPLTPPSLEHLVQICLAKEPDQRFQNAHDVKLQLEWILAAGSQAGAPALPIPRKSSRMQWIPAGILGLAVLVMGLGWWSARQPVRLMRSNLLPPEGVQFEAMYRNGPLAVSPDGTKIAFVGRRDGKNSLWVRSLDKLEATLLPGTEDAFYPFWSPDGTELAFFQHQKLWRMDLKGGSPAAICDVQEPRGGAWGSQNVIVFAPFTSGPLAQVPAGGGVPKAITNTPPNAPYMSDRWPTFLPDGRHVLFLRSPGGDADDSNEIRYTALDGSVDEVVAKGRYFTFQVAGGWLLAGHNGSLEAWKFDPREGKITGERVQVVDKIASDSITGLASFSVSPQGLLIYQEGTGASGDRHVWVDAAGKQLSQLSDPNIYGPMRISPDGSRLATTVQGTGGNLDLWVWDLAGGARARLSSGNDTADIPVWSADGRTLYFSTYGAKSRYEINLVPSDGSQPQHALIQTPTSALATDCSSDGKWLLYEEETKNGNSVLKASPLAAGLESFTVLDSVVFYGNARLKPVSNEWLAYQSNESGHSEVYLTRFPRATAKYQVSQAGATQPVWSKDGKKLFYLDGLQRMTSVEIETSSDGVRIGTPKTIFQTSIRNSISAEAYDVTRDGRFLVVNSTLESTAPVVLVSNWDAELKR